MKDTNIKTTTEINVQDIATALACAGDDAQAEFFNTFFKSLLLNCDQDKFRVDNQLCYIESKLNSRSKEYLKFMTFEE